MLRKLAGKDLKLGRSSAVVLDPEIVIVSAVLLLLLPPSRFACDMLVSEELPVRRYEGVFHSCNGHSYELTYASL